MKTILIIGARGHGRVVAEAAKECGYEKVDYLDDNNPAAIGKISELERLANNYDSVIVSIGNNQFREELIHRLLGINAHLVSVIHPRAFVAPSAAIKAGTIILPGAVINSNAHIGYGCIVSIGALADHDAVVDDFSHINTGAIISAGKKVCGKVDAGAVIR